MSRGDLFAVVLAGGSGTRFWPASRPGRPKQLLPLAADRRTLLEATVDRAVSVAGRERVMVVAGEDLTRRARDLLPALPREAFLVEPEARGTGPALAWAAHHVAGRAREAVMLSLHADHRIEPLSAFRETVRRAVEASRTGRRLFCIGVRPERPETGYGYVRLGEPLPQERVYEAREFVEKPSPSRAREFVDAGDYLWNTGIFAWRVEDFLEAVRSHAPEMARALPRLDAGDVKAFFSDVEPVSVDVAVMERAPAVGVVEATFEWDDLGVWPALARAFPRDEGGNVVVGPGRLVESEDNVVWSEDGAVTLFGVRGMVVARSGDDVLVTTRERAPQLKRMLRVLEERDEEEASREEGSRGGG